MSAGDVDDTDPARDPIDSQETATSPDRSDDEPQLGEDALTQPTAAQAERMRRGVVREAEVARMVAVGVHPDVARTLRFREEPDASKDKADEELRGLMATFGRRCKPPSGPMPVRPFSDAADFVEYSGIGAPVAPHTEQPEARSVVLTAELQETAQREAPTVLIATRRRAAWSRSARLGAAGVIVFVSLAIGVRSWRAGGVGNELVTSVAPSPGGPTPAAPAPRVTEPPETVAALEATPTTDNDATARSAQYQTRPSPSAAASPPARGRAESGVVRPPAKVSPQISHAAAESTVRVRPESRQHYLLDLP